MPEKSLLIVCQSTSAFEKASRYAMANAAFSVPTRFILNSPRGQELSHSFAEMEEFSITVIGQPSPAALHSALLASDIIRVFN